MSDFWGPTALDGELGYRRERLAGSYPGFSDGRPVREPDAVAAMSRPDGSLRPVHAAHPLLGAARGWVLRGSGAWHVAR
jgi:hypothetical protein